MSALEELFADEDADLVEITKVERPLTVVERVDKELAEYRSLPRLPSSIDPIMWWWEQRLRFPIMSHVSSRYLCVQASSTPSERIFSCAGDTISQERACLDPDKADKLIFLKKTTDD